LVGPAVALVVLLLPAGAQAASFDVTNTNDSGDGSLRQAILDANAADGADDIDAAGVMGTINLQSALPSLSESVDIAGPGADQLTVRRDAGGEYRIFDIAQAAETTISGLTIADGSVDGNGGGIFNAGALTVENVVITGNHADGDGGGVYSKADVAVNMLASEVRENSADGGGGGIYSDPGGLNVSASTIADNTAAVGGGVLGATATTIDETTVIGNSATQGSGGGLLADYQLKVVDSLVTENTATANGGGIETNVSEADITSSEVSNNSAGGFGGGIDAGFVALVRLSDVVVSGNAAAVGGGGIFVEQAAVITGTTISGNAATGPNARGGGLQVPDIARVSNSTITENTATGDGGGIWSRPFIFTVASSTIARNAANRGSNVFHEEAGMELTSTILADPRGDPHNCGYSYDFESHPSQGYNLADDNTCGLNQATDQSGVDALLWPLADDGGPTETMIPASASPAIDHGFAGTLTTDQRGLTRPHDLLGVPNPAGGDGADVGAVELQAGEFVPPPPGADLKPPKTKLTIRPKGKIKSEGGPVEVRFGFYGVDDVSPASELTFECKLDDRLRKPCVSPVDQSVAIGRHTFRVWASDAAGNTDPTPARARFKVKRQR
jgi:hypothetical protein